MPQNADPFRRRTPDHDPHIRKVLISHTLSGFLVSVALSSNGRNRLGGTNPAGLISNGDITLVSSPSGKAYFYTNPNPTPYLTGYGTIRHGQPSPGPRMRLEPRHWCVFWRTLPPGHWPVESTSGVFTP